MKLVLLYLKWWFLQSRTLFFKGYRFSVTSLYLCWWWPSSYVTHCRCSRVSGVLGAQVGHPDEWTVFKISLRLPLKILGNPCPTDGAIHIIWLLLTFSWAWDVPVLHYFSLPGGRLTNSDVVTDTRKELEGSETAGTSTGMSIFQNPFMGAQSCSQTPSVDMAFGWWLQKIFSIVSTGAGALQHWACVDLLNCT